MTTRSDSPSPELITPPDQCWICLQEEESFPTGQIMASFCDCTLRAHGPCVLTWINASDKRRPRCPACDSPFDIIESADSSSLRVVSTTFKRWNQLTIPIAAVGIAAGTWNAMWEYSLWAVPQICGPLVLEKTWYNYLNLPLLPLSLLLSRTPINNSIFPVYPLGLFLAVSRPARDRLVNGLYQFSTSPTFSYPPSPALVLCFLPFLRTVYMRSRKAMFGALELDTDSVGAMVDRMFDREEGQLVGEEEDVLQPREWKVIARFASCAVEALLLPALVNVVGGAFYYLATQSDSKLARYGRSILGIGAVYEFSKVRGRLYGVRLFQFEPTDPKYWRSFLAGGTILLARDVMKIGAGLLARRQKRSRRIVGRR